MYSTARDLWLWHEALYTDRLLAGEYRALLFRPNLDGYAYGWAIDRWPADGGAVAAHGGAIDGFSALIMHGLDDHRLIVLLSNYEGAGGTYQRIVEAISRIWAGQPYDAP